jgi:hypothetical protein
MTNAFSLSQSSLKVLVAPALLKSPYPSLVTVAHIYNPTIAEAEIRKFII